MIHRRAWAVLLPALSLTAACGRDQTGPAPKAVSMADSADQVMYGLRTVLTDRGVQRAELTADTAYFYDESTRADLRKVTTIFFTKEGARNGILTSKRGLWNSRANVMEARDNVVIVGVDGRKLSSPMVRFEQYRNLILSDSAFVLEEGDRRTEGVGFESDPQMLNVKIRQLRRATGASIVLPSSRSEPAVIKSGEAITAPPVPPPAAPVPVKP
jgi:LPS export ABC transporter protein LptC